MRFKIWIYQEHKERLRLHRYMVFQSWISGSCKRFFFLLVRKAVSLSESKQSFQILCWFSDILRGALTIWRENEHNISSKKHHVLDVRLTYCHEKIYKVPYVLHCFKVEWLEWHWVQQIYLLLLNQLQTGNFRMFSL